MWVVLLLTSILGLGSSAFANAKQATCPQPAPEHFERLRWIEKATRTLQGGRGPANRCESIELLKLADEQILDRLLTKSAFADTVLDFNMFFLGFRKDQIRNTNGELVDAVFDFPSALNSAREVLHDGDYLKILDLEQPFFHPPLQPPFAKDPEDKYLVPEVLRAKVVKRLQESLNEQIEYLRLRPNTPLPEACARFMNPLRDGLVLGETGIFLPLMDIGYKTNVWYGRIAEICIGPFRPAKVDFIAELEKVRAINTRLFEALKDFEPTNYSTKNLADLKSLDVAQIGLAPSWHMFGITLRQALQNSSTNFNRKRGAYVLSRFFCDDLTPLNVESPSAHATADRHASEASCMACHYKLDPMSGFFRNFGLLFGQYEDSDKVRFDDNAAAVLRDYVKTWRAPESAGREWNTGYVRSTTRDDLNTYGNDIKDLFQMIRTAPEVKRCLVKRMTEYFAGDQRTVDGEYLAGLTKQFAQLSTTNSSRAFKVITKQILLGRGFREPNPVPGQCYDYAPGVNPESRPPCKVAHILDQYCASCHSNTFEKPYLDLLGWTKLREGGRGFPHLDEQGNQYPFNVTMERMLSRMSSADPKIRMPFKRHIDALDREELFKWINESLNTPRAKPSETTP
jgi:hypothetical protein